VAAVIAGTCVVAGEKDNPAAEQQRLEQYKDWQRGLRGVAQRDDKALTRELESWMRVGGPDLDALRRIELPDNPTREQVVDYVSAILMASRGQRGHSSSHPQIAMLKKIGPENLDVLLEKASEGGDNFYLYWAIKSLVGDEHKPKILNALLADPGLLKVVSSKGWMEDAREILIEGLRKKPDYLPPQWIKTVASFADPDTYDDLKAYLIAGENRKATYEKIKDLPGIDLKETVALAWTNAALDRWERADMAPVAVQFGHLDALDLIVEALVDDCSTCGEIYAPRDLILRHTEARGTNEELNQWYVRHRHNLAFDEKAKVFRAPKAEAGGPPTEPSSNEIASQADLDKETLSSIKLPDNATREQVIEYVDQITRVLMRSPCMCLLEGDSRVAMLTKVGQKYPDILFEKTDSPEKFYIIAAIDDLANDETKQMIINALPRYNGLAEVIVDKKWVQDAKEILVGELRKMPNHLPTAWIRAVASFRDPETYDLLTAYLVNGSNKLRTYDAIRFLPSIDVPEAVTMAWDKVSRYDTYDKEQTAPVAVRYGHFDALETLVDSLDTSHPCFRYTAREAILWYTEARGRNDDLKDWFEQNRHRLFFDEKDKIFRVRKDE